MTYPESPGYQKGSATSQIAAEQFTGREELYAQIVFWMMCARETGLTTDEAYLRAKANRERTGKPDIDKTTIGARFTELHAAGKIIKTKQRRMTRHGRPASIYVHSEHYTEAMGKILPKMPGQKKDSPETSAKNDIIELLFSVAMKSEDGSLNIKLSPLDVVMVKKMAEKAGLEITGV